MPQPEPITGNTFSRFVAEHPRALIHFWGGWNGYDRIMLSRLISWFSARPRGIGFASVDVDLASNQDLCTQHQVLNVPFLAAYHDGALIATLVGLRDTANLDAWLSCLLDQNGNSA